MELEKAFRFLLTVYFYTIVSITFILSFVVLSAEAIILLPLILIKPKYRIIILGQTHFTLMNVGELRTPLQGR